MEIRCFEHEKVLGIAMDPEAAQARPFPWLHASLKSRQCRWTRTCGPFNDSSSWTVETYPVSLRECCFYMKAVTIKPSISACLPKQRDSNDLLWCVCVNLKEDWESQSPSFLIFGGQLQICCSFFPYCIFLNFWAFFFFNSLPLTLSPCTSSTVLTS